MHTLAARDSPAYCTYMCVVLPLSLYSHWNALALALFLALASLLLGPDCVPATYLNYRITDEKNCSYLKIENL